MPGLEFEKNVQQRLDELKLRPSEAVWKNVEYSIRQEKRRRRMILWLPLLFLLLGGTGYLLINKNGFVSAETAVKTQQTKEKNSSTTLPISKDLQNEVNEKDKNQVLSPKDLNEKSVANAPKDRNTNSNTKQSQVSTNKTFEKSTVKVTNNKDQIQSLTKAQENVDGNKNEVLLMENDEDVIGYANINPSLIKNSSPVVGISIPESHSATVQTPEVDLNAISAFNKNEKFRSAKWQWGLDFSAGSSSASGELNLLGPARIDNSGILVSGSPRASAGSSSSIEPGFYWSAGGFAQRNFTNRFALSTGLQYSQYNTQIITGTRSDSTRLLFGNSVAVADQGGKSSGYTNRYHFLELPVTAHFKLNKSNSFPVFGNVGISIGWLLGTNSLNSDLFNKTQFGLRGGFTFGALNKTKHPLRIGPSFRYNLSGLTENTSSNRHLLSFGLDFRVLLKK